MNNDIMTMPTSRDRYGFVHSQEPTMVPRNEKLEENDLQSVED